MSIPEYYQKAEDHQSILLLVKFLNSANSTDDDQTIDHYLAEQSIGHPSKFSDLYESINKELINLNATKINNNLSYERTIRLRFKKNYYELANNEWGDFQAHRKLYGLITISILDEDEFEEDNKVEDIYEQHKRFADNYSTLLDSRCLLLKVKSISSTDEKDCLIENELEEDDDVLINNLKNTSLNESSNDTNSSPYNGDKQQSSDSILSKITNCNLYDVKYDEDRQEFEMENVIVKVKQDLQDLVASLFYVLESKRLDKSYEKLEKIPLLLAPFENKSLVGLDTDSKSFKKKCLGRMRKHIGDLCLLVGSPSEALSNYSAAVDLLRPASDLLWLSAALEGQCVASLSLLYPNQPLSNLIDFELENQKILKKQNSFKRIFSLPKSKFRSSNIHQSTTPTKEQSKTDFQTPNNQQIEADASKLNSETSSLASNRSSKVNLTKLFLSNNNITPTFNSNSVNSKSLSANSLDPIMVKILGKSLLSTDEEIYERYKEACCHYAKFKMAAIVELECSLKATRVLAARDKFLQASEFIQNAAFITLETVEKVSDRVVNLSQSVKKNMEKTCVIGQLYEKIGFRRKSAFYQRLTALQTISSRIEKLERSNWEKCYYLLLPSTFGYHLTLDPLDYTKRVKERDIGWTSIHLQLLQELVTMSRKMGNDQLAMRHLSFILQALAEYLPSQLKGDLAKQLELLSSKCGEGAPVPLTLNNGYTISSVNLTKFPLVTKFEVQTLSDHLKPIKMKTKRRESLTSASIPSSPFIFTPIQLNKSHNRRRTVQTGLVKNVDFQWVQNELCVVNIEVYNPLPIELKVNHMALMTSDTIAFETKPISFSLPPDSGPQLIKLTGKPVEAGKLEILGYTSHVLGCKNNCKLIELPYASKKRFPSKFVIEVISSLPFLTCSIPSSPVEVEGNSCTDDERESTETIHNYPVKLYAGESKNLNLRIRNSSSDDLIELMNIKVVSSLPKDLEAKVINFDLTQIHKKIPLAANSAIELKITLYGAGDFITNPFNSNESSLAVEQQQVASSVNTPTHKKTQTTLGSTLVNFLSDLQSTPRHTAKQVPVVKKVNSSPTSKFSNKCLQLTLEIEYTGASGLTSGFCRQTKVTFQLEITPSLLITKCDVLPAVQTNHCYLVFDVLNATKNEMEVFYSSNKAIIIESKDTCRFPVPVERCPLVNIEHDKSTKESLFQSRQRYNKHSNKTKESLIERIVRNHLTKQIELSWKLTQAETKKTINGNAIDAINQVPWSTKMLSAISMCSIQFAVRLNDCEINPEQEFVHQLGELISIQIKVLNWSSLALKSLSLVIECFQDFENGNRRYNLENKRGLIGSDKLYIEEIKSEQSIDHQLKLVFFYTGVYKIDIRCLRNQFQGEIEKLETNDGLSESFEWRFSPTIELNVVE